MGLAEEKIIFIDNAEDAFASSLKGLDDDLVREIIKIYSGFVERGVLQIDALKLAELDESILKAITFTDFSKVANTYIKDFDTVNLFNERLHRELNDIEIRSVLRENERILNAVETVTTQIKGIPSGTTIKIVDGKQVRVPYRNGSLDALIQPISEIMRDDIISGVTFESATDRILKAIESNQLGLERWANTYARDSLSNYDGTIQNQLRTEFSLDWMTYVGTIKQNATRPFCLDMLRNHQTIRFDELQPILDEYIDADGIPSTNYTIKTTMTDKDGKRRPQQKGSGMIPGTNAENFFQRRGGYSCRHSVIPTSQP